MSSQNHLTRYALKHVGAALVSFGIVGAAFAQTPNQTINESAFIASSISKDGSKNDSKNDSKATAAFDVSDLWITTGEEGWGMSLNYHQASNQMFGVWYTYDPRRAAGAGISEPLWVVMPGGTWVTPTQFEGEMFVTRGTFFGVPWAGSAPSTKVGTYTLTFRDASNGTFTARVAPPAVGGSDPAAGLPAFVVNKNITRLLF